MSIIQRLIEKKQREKSSQSSQKMNNVGKDTAVGSKKEAGNSSNERQPPGNHEDLSKKPTSGQRQPNSNVKIKFDFKDLENSGFLTPSSMESQLAEEYRRIKRPLLVNAFESSPSIKNGNIILITSSLPDEGKTFTAINLAMSISMEKDKTVLLIDGDLQRAGLSNHFKLRGVTGLADLLNDDGINLNDIMYRTNIENLKIVPAGNRKSHSAELLASRDMEYLVQELSNRYSDRIVIVDSPPLLARSEPSVLAKMLGQIVVVVEAETTSQSIAKEALELLEECEIVNLILNKRHTRPGMPYFSGYYGY